MPYSWRVAILPYLEQPGALQRIQLRRALGRAQQPQAPRQDAGDVRLSRVTAARASHRPRTSSSPARRPCWARETSRRSPMSRMERRTPSWRSRPSATFPGPSPRTSPSIPSGSAEAWRVHPGRIQRPLRRRLRPVHQEIDQPDVLKALITRAGGEVINSDSF